jgi:hypothetical protein
MQLTAEDIREFRKLWQKEFQETLTEDEARYHASELLELYALLARPLPHEAMTDSPHDSTP